MRAFVLLLSLGLAVNAGAQPVARSGGAPGAASGGGLVGSVTDGASPLAGATVALYADSVFVTGAATGADGAFRLDGVPPGTYRVRVSFVGYVADEREGVAVRAGQTTDLGPVSLVPDAAQLGEADVSAERELVEQRADRTVYYVAAQPVTAGGSALEALQTLPSVEVDTEGNLSLRGGQNVAVYLNGRPVPVRGAQLAALLRQIPAQNVERVEVMPNPSARYEPDGMAGIIDIVLKQNADRGLSGGVTVGGGTFPSGQASGNVAYQRGPLDVSGSYGYRYDGSGLVGTTTRVVFERPTTFGDETLRQGLDIDNGTGSHLVTGALDYTVAPGTVLGLSGTLGLRAGTADQSVTYAFDPTASAAATALRTTDGAVDGLTGDAALTARRELGEGHRLTAEARWTRNDDGRDERYEDLLTGGSTVFTRSDVADLVDESSAQVDYVRPLAGLQVEVGAKGTHRDLASSRAFYRGPDGSAALDGGLSGAFAYDETVAAAYAQGSRTWGPLQVQAGLRAETAWRDVTPGGGAAPIESRYTSLYPSAFALYTFAPGTSLKASTSRRVNRPQALALNPTPRFQDTLIVDAGNPELRPEYTTAWELSAQYRFWLTVTPFYRRTTDVIRRRITFVPETGGTRGTFQNLDTQDSYGVDLTVTPRLGPVRGMVVGSAYRSMTEGGSAETGLASDGMIYTLRGNVQAELREGTTAQLFGFYRGPIDTEDGRISPFGIASLGLSHQVSDRLQLAANVNDLFGTGEFSFETGSDLYRLTGLRVPRIRQATATLTYTFGRQGPRRPRPQAQQQDGGMGVGF